MFFASDNWAGAHPKINEAIANNSTGFTPAYGAGELDETVNKKFDQLFGQPTSVFFTATGTAANSLAFAAYNRPGAVGFCHRHSHIREDECGAPEFLAPGARLRIVDGPYGKMTPENLDAEIQDALDFGLSAGTPAFVSITQATEFGTVHTLDEIDALVKVAKAHNLPVHLDGARFANALDALGCSAADMTTKRGIDVVSFGGTKNGCWCAEAIIFMNPEDATNMPYIRKRSGQVISKSRFIAAQFDAYLTNNLWMEMAAHANDMAAQLESVIHNSGKLKMAWQRDANEVFAITSREHFAKMQAAGAKFYDWPVPYGQENIVSDDEIIIRIVTSFATTSPEIEAFASLTE
jgi:threonine aldolase